MDTSKKWSSSLDKFFSAFEKDIRALSPGQKTEEYETLAYEFNQRLSKIKHQQAEIEFGQHIEGIYGINDQPTAPFSRNESPKWKP